AGLVPDGVAEVGRAEDASLVAVLQEAAEDAALEVVGGQARPRCEALGRPPVAEVADDVAEVEDDGPWRHTPGLPTRAGDVEGSFRAACASRVAAGPRRGWRRRAGPGRPPRNPAPTGCPTCSRSSAGASGWRSRSGSPGPSP